MIVIVVACTFIFLAVSVLMALLMVGANYGKDKKLEDEEQLEAIRIHKVSGARK
ncbi:hypothetical protein NXH76_23215 [Blautia schinkii]|nr:hypothetical protein [Blautia schinkii]